MIDPNEQRIDFLQRKALLQKAFTDSAFRYGTSLFRFGLIPSNVSDHLPIDIRANINDENHNILSWNMLSDDHLSYISHHDNWFLSLFSGLSS
jgi:hypothetical protein